MSTPSHDQNSLRDELKAVVDTALPQNPGQFGAHLIKQQWGAGIDPQTALLVTLDYDYRGHPAQNGVHQGQVANSRTLVETLLSDYQIVGDGRFGETAFGLYTPPDVGPPVRIVSHVDEFADHGSGNHKTYEGIYRFTRPQVYGPQTQIDLRPADFKKWVWTLFFKDKYQAYVDNAWPSDQTISDAKPYPLRTSTKAAFVMSAWLQRQENALSRQGFELAMQAAGLPRDQVWETLTMQQLQAPTRIPSSVEASRLKLYRYTSTDIWCYRDRVSSRVLLYIPGNSSPLHDFVDTKRLRQWIVEQGKRPETKQALAAHFAADDRRDGAFHAGVLTALDGMAVYPREHWLTAEAGFFNNDGYWDPDDYISFEFAAAKTDPFAQLVLTMKRAAQASVETIRDDAQVNRDNLSAIIEPIVQWVNQFGPLALFVPGGEGLLVLAGLIDAGYGLNQAINGETADKRSEGFTRTVFGLLNALPLAEGVASLRGEGGDVAGSAKAESPEGQTSAAPSLPGVGAEAPPHPMPPPLSRVDLLRGVGVPAGTFSDEVLAQIGRVSAIDDDMLRLMQSGRAPTPLLADTIDRFRIDQEVAGLSDPSATPAELFNRRYQTLQKSEHKWVQLFQRQYPGLPKTAVEQMLDRYGIDFRSPSDAAQARQLFSQLDSKARQYQQHVRLNRAFEGLYLRSISNLDSDTLALHSLKNLPGWPKGLRLEIRDSSIAGRLLDRNGPLDTLDSRVVVRSGTGYLPATPPTDIAATTDFYDAVVSVLSTDERFTLGLVSSDPGNELKLKVGDRPLLRSELMLGLGRMDSGLPFESQGLRGGTHPNTPQTAALTHQMMKLQLKDIYPEFSDSDADAVLQRVGSGAQNHIDHLRQQLQQLHVDLESWLDQVTEDIHDMDVPVLQMGDPGTEGLTFEELALRNIDILRDSIEYELETRGELADELISIFQKRAPQPNSHYSGDHVSGFTMNMNHEDFHRLPDLNVRFNDVVGMNLGNFHLIERGTLNGFLERFPNLRTLNLEETDLRLPDMDGQLVSVLPPAILQLQHLSSLNLRATRLTFQGNEAGQLTQLINLQSLDLGKNPLGAPPVVIGMNQLRILRLDDTQITSCPIGIADQPYLDLLDLRNNGIHRVPQAILNQATARDRVLLWNNPITDEDTLRRLVSHREKTGVNLWLASPGHDYSGPQAWLRDLDQGPRNDHLQIWQRLTLRSRSGRFLGIMNTLTLTADFQVNFLDLQVRVWRLLAQADASQELWGRLIQDIALPAGAFDNPFAAFTTLEDRAKLYNNWVALGRPFPPVGGEV